MIIKSCNSCESVCVCVPMAESTLIAGIERYQRGILQNQREVETYMSLIQCLVSPFITAK